MFFLQLNDSSSHEVETKVPTPLSSPVKSSRSNMLHASSAPSLVSASGTESRSAPLLTNSDSDEGERNKKKVQCLFLLIFSSASLKCSVFTSF